MDKDSTQKPSIWHAKAKTIIATSKAIATIHNQQQKTVSTTSPDHVTSSFKSKIASQHDKAAAIAAETEIIKETLEETEMKHQEKANNSPKPQKQAEKPPSPTTSDTQQLPTSPPHAEISPTPSPTHSLNIPNFHEEFRGSASSRTSSILSKEFEDAIVLVTVAEAQNHKPDVDLGAVYAARLVEIQNAFVICTFFLVALSGVLQFVYIVLPWYLASRGQFMTIVLPSNGMRVIYKCWVIFLVSVLLIMCGNALIQWPQSSMWGRVGCWRWFIPFILWFYLLTAILYYSEQYEGISHGVRSIMETGMKKKGSEAIQLIQTYSCCGVHSPKDWEPYAADPIILYSWHGDLCDANHTNKADFGDAIYEVCHVPSSCWKLLNQFTNFRHMRVVRQVGCLHKEILFSQWMLVLWIIMLVTVVVALATTFCYLFVVILTAEKNGIKLGNEFRYERSMV